MNGRNISRRTVAISQIAQHLNQKVNLIGIVVEFSFPRKSSGTDYVSILKIVDQSQHYPELSINIFTEKLEQLPVVKSHGVFIVLHNVTIREHGGEVNAVFNKKNSSFALVDGNNCNDFLCYQSLGSISLSWRAMDYLTYLRNFWRNAHLDPGKSEYLMSIKDLVTGAYFDLVCKVLHISYDASKGLWMLFVWDGTDAPLLSLDGKLIDDAKNPLPLQVESSSLDFDTLSKFHRVGTVLRVMADNAHENLGLLFEGVGKWVRIRNMTGKVLAGMWYGALNSLSRVRLLADNDTTVEDCKREFKQRKFEYDRLPLWSLDRGLTVIYFAEAERIQFITLMDVLSHEEDDSIFFCVVRVVAIHLFEAEDLGLLYERGKCEMRLTLEDPTARIHAFLLEEEEEEEVKFFNVFPSDVLAAKMKRLLGVPEHQNLLDGNCTRFPPLVKCGLDSTRDASGNRVFYICCTRLA